MSADRDTDLALKILEVERWSSVPVVRPILRSKLRELVEWDRARRPVVATGAGIDALAGRIADGVLDAFRPVLNATPGFHGLPWRELVVAVVREHLSAGAIVEPPRDGREA